MLHCAPLSVLSSLYIDIITMQNCRTSFQSTSAHCMFWLTTISWIHCNNNIIYFCLMYMNKISWKCSVSYNYKFHFSNFTKSIFIIVNLELCLFFKSNNLKLGLVNYASYSSASFKLHLHLRNCMAAGHILANKFDLCIGMLHRCAMEEEFF